MCNPREITVFRSYSRMGYPGHFRLTLERRGTKIDTEVDDAFCDDGYGRKLLCSGIFVNKVKYIKLPNLLSHDRAGPLIPHAIEGELHTDVVPEMRYYCPNIRKTSPLVVTGSRSASRITLIISEACWF
ncbi:hypothetical protein DPMN_038843 [Dreissena polymorpha]|uniref:Uncharacterized protein n=1 Tax=Dreissena polymorpha TaxID=45954 RepID=A0A9D4MH42_DREPO|nr:hypothetical protein DPMN_038843 [Dreissena polymorpha]